MTPSALVSIGHAPSEHERRAPPALVTRPGTLILLYRWRIFSLQQALALYKAEC